MAIQDVITHAQAAIKSGVSKIVVAEPQMVDSALTVCTCNAYADNIRIKTVSAGFVITLFDLRLNVMIPRNDLRANMYFLQDIPESIAAVFTADPTIGGHASTFDGEIVSNLGFDKILNVDVIGWDITVPNIKIM